LALANQVYFDAGLAKGIRKLDRLKERPPEMEQLITTIATSPDVDQILLACEQVTEGTRTVLVGFQRSNAGQASPHEVFRQVYPELRDAIGKLCAACEQQDPVIASMGAWSLQHELTTMLSQVPPGVGDNDFNLFSEFAPGYFDLKFPDLIALSSGPLDELSAQVRLLDLRLREWLRDQSVDLCEFHTIEELMEFL